MFARHALNPAWLAIAAITSAGLAGGCGGAEPMTEVRPETAAAQSSLGASCVLGDGYVIPDGGHLVIYPVSCGSDCFDFPNGGLDFALFCVNGVLGPNDPLLTGGTVGPPYLTASIYNGYSRCTALPNGHWHQSANRKTCVWVP